MQKITILHITLEQMDIETSSWYHIVDNWKGYHMGAMTLTYDLDLGEAVMVEFDLEN